MVDRPNQNQSHTGPPDHYRVVQPLQSLSPSRVPLWASQHGLDDRCHFNDNSEILDTCRGTVCQQARWQRPAVEPPERAFRYLFDEYNVDKPAFKALLRVQNMTHHA